MGAAALGLGRAGGDGAAAVFGADMEGGSPSKTDARRARSPAGAVSTGFAGVGSGTGKGSGATGAVIAGETIEYRLPLPYPGPDDYAFWEGCQAHELRIQRCTNCGTLLRSKAGDCCVFCSYGSVKCPPVQAERGCGCGGRSCG